MREPDVMIRNWPELLLFLFDRLRGVPKQQGRNRTARHRQTDDIGRIRRLFRVNGKAVIDRCVCRNHDGSGTDNLAGRSLYVRGGAAFDIHHMTASKNASAAALNRLSQTV